MTRTASVNADQALGPRRPGPGKRSWRARCRCRPWRRFGRSLRPWAPGPHLRIIRLPEIPVWATAPGLAVCFAYLSPRAGRTRA
jgi:hypothetical protein